MADEARTVPEISVDTWLQMTSDEQFEWLRQATLSQRIELAVQRIDAERERMRIAIRDHHPDYSEDDVKFALFRQCIRDDELFEKAWPHAPLLDP